MSFILLVNAIKRALETVKENCYFKGFSKFRYSKFTHFARFTHFAHLTHFARFTNTWAG